MLLVSSVGPFFAYVNDARSHETCKCQTGKRNLRFQKLQRKIQSVLLTMGIMMPETCWV